MMLTREEEQRLIRRVLQGNSGAFEPLVRAYQQKIYNLSLRMTKNPADAEDLTQEAFLKAFRSLERFRQDSGFYVWIYRIASNLCIDFLRREKQRGENTVGLTCTDGAEDWSLELPDLRALPEQELERKELRQALQAGFDALPPRQREILVLRDINGLSYGEIAAVLELEPGTVKSRISRARAALAALLAQSGNLFAEVASKKGKGR